MPAISGAWKEALQEEYSKDYYKDLFLFVKKAYSEAVVYPPSDELFTAFHRTPMENVKVVILGQDPYHNEGQAHGLCFSVKPGTDLPPSLVNIYKELKEDLGISIPSHGCLNSWADQGVLLLNTVLTVEAHKPLSHRGKGWEEFTDAVIQKINEIPRPIVFILWGGPARSKKKLLNNPKHLILEAPHPSPLSAYRGFFGSKPFSKTNDFLISQGLEPINWEIPEILDKKTK
ncbi:MAG: uracil-DNA glycosylase [Eubacterium sp.]|nr:uracil-DNA glycosylase [Eubacterium sp.]